ncbi:glycosyltransferase family 2 protein [Microbulbifer sp. JTAC008]|uniref:glycosyltransferase family 2 protein n=1 Tax=unclassified Microbulbifer TaxID=2619833 RepID=UPI0040397789
MEPKFSIIVPVYQHWCFIAGLLSHLESQSFKRTDFELVLVANDPPVAFLKQKYSFSLKILKCSTPGAYAARNLGIQFARGEWLLFTDADCLPAPCWVEEINAAILNCDSHNALFAGRVVCVKNNFDCGVYHIYDYVKGIPQEKYVQSGVAATANLAVRKSFVEQVGMFNESLYSGGDFDFCARATVCGGELIYLPQAVVAHRVRNSWYSLAVKARRVKGGQFSKSHGIARLGVILRTLCPPFRSALYFLGRNEHPLKFRFFSVLVQFQLWLVEVFEVVKLVAGATPERR